MNNRKLMGALSILLLAILFMTIGCGDGKRNHNRSNGVRKVNPKNPNGGVGNQKELKTKSEQITRIEGSKSSNLEAGQTGTAIGPQDLGTGTFTLTSASCYMNYMRQQDEVKAIITGTVNGGNLSNSPVDQVGLMGKDSDRKRTVEVPAFNIPTLRAQPMPDQQDRRVYSCETGPDGKLTQALGTAGAADINLLSRLGNNSTTGAIPFELSGVKGQIHLYRIDPKTVRMTVTLEEMRAAEKGKQNSTLIKKMAFTYTSNQAVQGGQQQGGQVQPPPTREQTQPGANSGQPTQNGQIPLEEFQGVPSNSGLPGTPGNTD